MDEYVKNTPHEAGQVINSLSKLNSKFRLVKTPNAVDLVSGPNWNLFEVELTQLSL